MHEFAHGLIIGKFYPLHAGHSALIRTALARCERVTVELLVASVESVSLETRAEWIRQEHPTVVLRTAIDDAPVDYHSDEAWDEHMAVIERLLDGPVDAVFTSDSYGQELARRLGAEWVQVDEARSLTPVSGRRVRADLAGQWHWLAASVRESLASRVVVLGAESTGSTTLAQALADYYSTTWVPEYGREYTVTRDGGLTAPWRSDEFAVIVDRQIAMEQEAARRVPTPLLVCDTDVFATALWHERYVGTAHQGIRQRAAGHRPILYVLTGDEIPFVADGTRDGEHIRHGMQQRFRDELAVQGVPWVEVRGSVAERLATAVEAIDAVLHEAMQFAAPLDAASDPAARISE